MWCTRRRNGLGRRGEVCGRGRAERMVRMLVTAV